MTRSDAIVYVIDDDLSVRRAVARLVRTLGLEVETFASAQDFLDHTPDDRPACLLLDVRMPGQTGLDLQTTLARSGRDLGIVFITGHGTVPMGVGAMKKGAVDFLPKPFNDHELIDAVDRALAKSREARRIAAERTAVQRRLDMLTPRERQVLELVVTGMLNKQIGAALGAAEKTIKVHRARVMQKMAAGSVADLVRMTQKVTPVGETS